jgi:DNA-binding response OmpR family regulator
MRLLIVESDALAAHILGLAARRLGHKTFAVRDWRESEGALPFAPTACVSGIELLTPESWLPLLSVADRFPGIVTMLTATRIPDPAVLLALRAGVGDVVRKPYNPFELIERIARLADANGNGRAPEICTLADLSVDLSHYSARKSGTDLRLTKLELRLLFCLLANSGRLAPTERLMTFGWEGMEPPEPSLLKTHISHLRSKLQDAGGVAIEINARHSLGYAIALSGSRASAETVGTLTGSTNGAAAGRALDPLSTSKADASTPAHSAFGGNGHDGPGPHAVDQPRVGGFPRPGREVVSPSPR